MLDKSANETISGNYTFSGDIYASNGIYGAATGAPDRRIWAVSAQYNNWGIFYNEGNPDLIEFQANGVVKASIELDNGNFNGNTLTLSQATGTAPMTISSTTVVSNLNADLLDGNHASAFATSGHTHSGFLTTSGFTMAGAIDMGDNDITPVSYTHLRAHET